MITCTDISKKFRWYERNDSLKTSFVKFFDKSKKIWEWYVLKDINLQIKEGEKVGLIGKNGCGKSTLLKLIAGIHIPTSGKIINNANRMLALIELGVGFYKDLTGKENIKLNWVFNGLPKSELKNKFDKIVEFSGVGDYTFTFLSALLRINISFLSTPKEKSSGKENLLLVIPQFLTVLILLAGIIYKIINGLHFSPSFSVLFALALILMHGGIFFAVKESYQFSSKKSKDEFDVDDSVQQTD